jgi:CubicO group peptidase (beta-lactamase class C family)
MICCCTPPPAQQPRVAPPPREAAAKAPANKAPDPAGLWKLRWDRGPAGWSPRFFAGTLGIERAGGRLSARLQFDQSSAEFDPGPVVQRGAHLSLVVNAHDDDGSPADNQELELAGWLRGERVVGEMRWGTLPWTPFWGHRQQVKPLVAATAPRSLPQGPLQQAGFDRGALEALLRTAAEQNSSAVILVQDGKLVLERYRASYTGPVNLMSATKSVVSLAVLHLVAAGKLKLETRVASLFPRWRRGPRAAITIRQLLNHTSGLDTRRAGIKGSIRIHALGSQLMHRPGARFTYNNNAVDLLAVVVRRVSGLQLDAYLERHIFRPLQIEDARWARDAEGTPLAAGGLSLRPVDLAKIGQLILDGGTHDGQQVLPEELVQAALAPGSPLVAQCGLLWWRVGEFDYLLTQQVLDVWARVGVPARIIKRLRPLLGRRHPDHLANFEAIKDALGEQDLRLLQRTVSEGLAVPLYHTRDRGQVRLYEARGWLGQHLLLIPRARLVAIRLRQATPADRRGDPEADTHHNFRRQVEALLAAGKGPAPATTKDAERETH